MNILFLTLLDFDNIDECNIYTDLLRKFYQEGHRVYAISPIERKRKIGTYHKKVNDRLEILKLRIGNIQKTNIVEKGISTIMLEPKFIMAVQKYYAHVQFDLILYCTPPITFQRVVKYVKKRDKAITYLLLKDIFPQNALDIGLLKKTGIQGLVYRYFRNKEKCLYKEADYIGSMSEANREYVKKNNPYINSEKIEICPNCIEPSNRAICLDEKRKIRKKLGIPEEVILFIYGGNLGKPQGIPFLIECLDSVSNQEDIYFLIIGNGTEYCLLEEFIKTKNPSNIKLMRALPPREYEEIVFATDVGMVFLNYRFTIPNFPSRILSYMDAGLPILVATDKVTDIGDIIEKEGIGIKIQSNNVSAFMEAVDCLKRSTQLSAMGNKAKKYLNENFHIENAYTIIMKHFCKEQ